MCAGVPLAAAAANAWADYSRSGLGGWFVDAGWAVNWFHDVPRWAETHGSGRRPCRGESALLELLSEQVVLRHFSDNFSAVGSMANGLSTKFPLEAMLMIMARVCLDLGH